MALSYEDQLTSLQTAIQRLESKAVSSVNIIGRNVTYMNLDVLYSRELWLMNQIGKANRGGKIKVTSLRP